MPTFPQPAVRRMAVVLSCLLVIAGAPAFAATPVALAFPGGVCVFQANKITAAAGTFSAEGTWGPGCPGYVTPPPPSSAGDCTQASPSPGLTRLTRVTAGSATYDALHFASLYGAFPGTTALRTLRLPKNTYIALEFTVPLVMAPRTLGKFSNLSTGTSATFSETITRCPGDFRPAAALGTGCGLSTASEGNLSFIVDYAGGQRCNLAPGGRYYLNVIHAPLGAATASTCKASVCTATIKNAPGQ